MNKRLLSIIAILYVSIVATSQQVKPPVAKPLPFHKFEELPLSAIHPEGWLKEFLTRQKNGMTGDHFALGYPFNTALWNGVLQRSGDYGDESWRYEQTGYLVDGIIRLGYLLGDSDLIRKGEDNVHYTLANVKKDGRIGPDKASEWPNAVFFRVLKAYYLSRKDPKLLSLLEKHYLTMTPSELGYGRNIVNLEGMLWLYSVNGNKKLLDLAEKSYAAFNNPDTDNAGDLTLAKCLSKDTIIMHGVSYMEQAKLPAILYMHTGKKTYLDAAVNAFEKLQQHHMLPDGVPSSNEHLAGKDIMQSHETCDITDYSWALGYLLMANGDAKLADRIEKAMFNAGPGAVTKDFRALQYFSGPNQPIATFESNHNKMFHGETWMAYSPVHMTECCSGNVNRFMPNFASRMWMRDVSGGLVSVFYSPSAIDFSFNGKKIHVKQITNYPFSDSIVYKFENPSKAILPFSFRIPAWCSQPKVLINGAPYAGVLKPGSFVTIQLPASVSNTVVIKLPMKASVAKVADNGLTVDYGPLLFAYSVPTKAEKDTAFHPNMHGKRAADPNFPAWNLRPAGDWNYALLLNDKNFQDKITVIKKNTDGYPLDPGFSPIVLKVPARRMIKWTLIENRFTPPLPPAEEKQNLAESIEYIELIPYGATCLRIAVFPGAFGQ